MESHKQEALAIMQRMFFVTNQHDREALHDRAKEVFDTYYDLYISGF